MSFPWGADTERFVSALFELAADPDPLTSIQTFVVRQSLLRAWSEFQEKHALIVAPTCTDIPFEVGKDLTTAGVAEILRGMRMAIAVNALGLRQAGGLPIGREQRFTLARMARDQERVYRRLLEQRNPRVDGDSGGAVEGIEPSHRPSSTAADGLFPPRRLSAGSPPTHPGPAMFPSISRLQRP
jgi:hypothetical protein